MLTRSEVREHYTRKSCWVIINNTVYDITDFVDSHPGGSGILLKYAGCDATEAFEPLHRADTLEKYLTADQNLGPVSIEDHDQSNTSENIESKATTAASKRVRLSSIISIADFEHAASQHLPLKSFAFLKTGAEDENAVNWNRNSWKAIRLRPRVLRPIDRIDMSRTIFGNKFSAPFFICPAGGAKVANPGGDICLTKAAGKHDILHWVCNNAGFNVEEMANARVPGQTTYWQIYAMTDLAVTEMEIKHAISLGYKGFALTVDAIWAGKRERDVRAGFSDTEADGDEEDDEEDDENDDDFSREPSVTRPPVYSHFDWPAAVQWLQGLTDLPIAIKGIQCWEDAALCMHYGVHPWLSNHGGRQLDGAPSAADTLVSIRKNCPEVFDKCEVVVDGGITRGSDVIKAIALGARAVGLGRGFLYSLVLGERGTSKAIRILKHEIETTMALLGVSSLDQLNPSYVDASSLDCAFARAHL